MLIAVHLMIANANASEWLKESAKIFGKWRSEKVVGYSVSPVTIEIVFYENGNCETVQVIQNRDNKSRSETKGVFLIGNGLILIEEKPQKEDELGSSSLFSYTIKDSTLRLQGVRSKRENLIVLKQVPVEKDK